MVELRKNILKSIIMEDLTGWKTAKEIYTHILFNRSREESVYFKSPMVVGKLLESVKTPSRREHETSPKLYLCGC